MTWILNELFKELFYAGIGSPSLLIENLQHGSFTPHVVDKAKQRRAIKLNVEIKQRINRLYRPIPEPHFFAAYTDKVFYTFPKVDIWNQKSPICKQIQTKTIFQCQIQLDIWNQK